MAKINVMEMTMVKPAKKMKWQTIWLSRLDLTNKDVHTPFIYLYKPNEATNFFNLVVLKEALRF